MNYNFTLNGQTYRIRKDHRDMLQGIITAARETGDTSAVQAFIELSVRTGSVEKVAGNRRASERRCNQ